MRADDKSEPAEWFSPPKIRLLLVRAPTLSRLLCDALYSSLLLLLNCAAFERGSLLLALVGWLFVVRASHLCGLHCGCVRVSLSREQRPLLLLRQAARGAAEKANERERDTDRQREVVCFSRALSTV